MAAIDSQRLSFSGSKQSQKKQEQLRQLRNLLQEYKEEKERQKLANQYEDENSEEVSLVSEDGSDTEDAVYENRHKAQRLLQARKAILRQKSKGSNQDALSDDTNSEEGSEYTEDDSQDESAGYTDQSGDYLDEGSEGTDGDSARHSDDTSEYSNGY